MARKRSLGCASVLVLLALAACGGSPSQPTPTATVIVSGLERYTGGLVDGMAIQLTATLRSAAGATEDCTATAAWTTSNDALVRPTGVKPGEFLLVAPGDATVSATCSGTVGRLIVHADKATSWPITGRVFAAPDGPPIADATLTYGASEVRSDASGAYTIVTTDGSVQKLTATAAGFQTRETYVRGGTRRTLDIDLIGHEPVFPFNVYRILVRQAYVGPPAVSAATPTYPWTKSPNVYIWSAWKDTGAPVANMEWRIAEIRRVIPQLTGGHFQAGIIEYGADQRPLTPGWINIQFDHSGSFSTGLGADPTLLQLASDDTCSSLLIIHEFGHAMGLSQSNIRPSVMGGLLFPTCQPVNLSPEVKVLYSRPRGNMEPDRDPDGTVLMTAPNATTGPIICDRCLQR